MNISKVKLLEPGFWHKHNALCYFKKKILQHDNQKPYVVHSYSHQNNKMIRYTLCAIIESHNRKRRQSINSFEFENMYNIIYQLVVPDVNIRFSQTLLHVAWLYGGWIRICLKKKKKLCGRKNVRFVFRYNTVTICGYKIKIDGKFIQRTTFSFSTDSLLNAISNPYTNTNIKWVYFLSKKLFAKCLFEDF